MGKKRKKKKQQSKAIEPRRGIANMLPVKVGSLYQTPTNESDIIYAGEVTT